MTSPLHICVCVVVVVCFITAEKGGLARAKGEGEKEEVVVFMSGWKVFSDVLTQDRSAWATVVTKLCGQSCVVPSPVTCV